MGKVLEFKRKDPEAERLERIKHSLDLINKLMQEHKEKNNVQDKNSGDEET